MDLFGKRGSLNLSKTSASNQVKDEVDPSFEKPETDLWTFSIDDGDTAETDISMGNSYRVVDDDDDHVNGWNGMKASMDDEGSMNFIPGAVCGESGRGGGDFGSHGDGCCERCRYSCRVACRPCTTKHNPLPPNASQWERVKYAFLCPPHDAIGRYATYGLLVILVWAVMYSITGDEALPQGNLFGLYILIISSVVLGAIVSRLKLPALLGMLAAGFLLRNTQAINITSSWARALRSIVLAVILLRAGLGIDARALRRLSLACLRLSFLPSLVDASMVAVAGHFFLDFPWDWAFMLGFVLASVSPAVVIPCLLRLQKRGYGVKKGIPTLTIASCSLDNVMCISAFGIALGISFSSGSLAMKILQGPLEVVIGVSYGIVAGVLLWYIPSKDLKTLTVLRFIFLLCGGVFAIFGSAVVSFPGAGPLGCLTLAFMAAVGFKEDKIGVSKLIGITWVMCEPILFGLIGAEISLEYLDGKTVGLGVATLVLGLVVRVAATFLSVLGAQFNNKEKLFIVFSWIPKATVQAALGPVALDEVRNQNPVNADDELRGIQLLTLAVLSILLTAPVGAILISLTGPKLLEQETKLTTIGQSEAPGVGHDGGGEGSAQRERLTSEEQANA